MPGNVSSGTNVGIYKQNIQVQMGLLKWLHVIEKLANIRCFWWTHPCIFDHYHHCCASSILGLNEWTNPSFLNTSIICISFPLHGERCFDCLSNALPVICFDPQYVTIMLLFAIIVQYKRKENWTDKLFHIAAFSMVGAGWRNWISDQSKQLWWNFLK